MKLIKYLLFFFLTMVSMAQVTPGYCGAPTWDSLESRQTLEKKVKALAGDGLDSERAARISRAVLKETRAKTFPSPDQVLAVIKTESNFDPMAGHRVGPSLGLMQVNVGVHKLKNPYSVEENIQTGVRLLREYHSQTGNETKALMYYNMGPAGTKRACKKKCSTPYVNKVNASLRRLETMKG